MLELDPNDLLSRIMPRQPIRLGQAKVSFEKSMAHFQQLSDGLRRQQWLMNRAKADINTYISETCGYTIPNLFIAKLYQEVLDLFKELQHLNNPVEYVETVVREDPNKGVQSLVLSVPHSNLIRGFERTGSTELFRPDKKCFLSRHIVEEEFQSYTAQTWVSVSTRIDSKNDWQLRCLTHIHDHMDMEETWRLIEKIYSMAEIQKWCGSAPSENAIDKLVAYAQEIPNFGVTDWLKTHTVFYTTEAMEELIECLGLPPEANTYIRSTWTEKDKNNQDLLNGPLVGVIAWQADSLKNLWKTTPETNYPPDIPIKILNEQPEIEVNLSALNTFLGIADETIDTLNSHHETWQKLTTICTKELQKFGIKI